MEDGVRYRIGANQRISEAVVDALQSKADVREENIPDRLLNLIESQTLDSVSVEDDHMDWSLTVSCDSLHVTVTNGDELFLTSSRA